MEIESSNERDVHLPALEKESMAICDVGAVSLAMAGDKTLANEVSMAGECLLRLIVHINDHTFFIADGDSAIHLFSPFRYHIHLSIMG